MRALFDASGAAGSEDLSDAQVTDLYRSPRPWLRVNMVTTLDGAAAGADGDSGSIHDDADSRVFAILRSLADVIIVGSSTAEREGYRPADVPIALLSRSGKVPESLRDAPSGAVVLVTVESSPGLTQARALLGDEQVWALGEDDIDLVAMRARMEQAGWGRMHAEGGPRILGQLLAAGVVDEFCATIMPTLLAGDHPRIATGPEVQVPLDLALLLAQDSTLLGRWLVSPRR